MGRYDPAPTKRMIGGVAVLLIGLMAVGSVWDYPLSCAVYNEQNPFGIFFAAYGEYPATLGFVISGTMLAIGHSRSRRLAGILQTAAGILLAAMGALMACFMPTLYLGIPAPAVTVIGLVCSGLAVFATARLCREVDRRLLRRIALAVFLIIFIEMILVNLIKVPWGRARMRLVANDPRAYFMPWWQAGGPLKAELTAAGVAGEEFKSFPSGHTANATVMLLAGLLPLLRPQWAHRKHLLLGFGLVWTGLVAFSRIIMGAHYLTDTVVGAAIGFTVYCLVCRLLLRPKTETGSLNGL